MVKVTATAGGEIKQIEIDPKAIDPSDPELLGDLVTAAVNEALRRPRVSIEGEGIPRDRDRPARPRPRSSAAAQSSARPRGCRPVGLGGLPGPCAQADVSPIAAGHNWRRVQPVGREPRRAADAAARRRGAHRAAARVPHPAAAGRRGARARGRAARGEGARPLLPRVREPDRGGALRICTDARRDHTIDLRGRAAGRPRVARTDARVPRALPRARRRAQPARRRRARATCASTSCSGASRRTACRRSSSRRTRT